jgi:hypothetical protein
MLVSNRVPANAAEGAETPNAAATDWAQIVGLLTCWREPIRRL